MWSEASWGIYFDAAKLDGLAVSILDDLKCSSAFVPQGVAALLAFGLTLAHEQFHARVEAATMWLELSTLQPRHIRYSERVYDALKLTPQWLEEALANWSAWAWFKSEPIQAAIGRYSSRAPQIERVVENTLDLSHPDTGTGDKENSGSAWRILATQLADGKPTPSGPIGLPLESQLAGPFPYDFTATDVPVRFVGKGVIADRLLSRPATFNVPARDELERALKTSSTRRTAQAARAATRSGPVPTTAPSFSPNGTLSAATCSGRSCNMWGSTRPRTSIPFDRSCERSE